MAMPRLKSCKCLDLDAGRGARWFFGAGGAVPISMVFRIALLIALLWIPGGAIARQDAHPVPSDASNSTNNREPQDPMAHHAEQRMGERRNEERQKALAADTDKLLTLAQQLKIEVDKSSKDQLSVDVFKRAEQIEKLARSVKEKMRGY